MRGVRVTTSNGMDLHCKDYKNKLKNQFNEINESSAVASRPKQTASTVAKIQVKDDAIQELKTSV